MIKVKISSKKVLEKLKEQEQITSPESKITSGTFGELKQLIASVIAKEKGKKVAGVGVDMLTGVLGLDAVKTAYDLFKAVYSAPDNKKTNSIIDKFNVDDDYSKIVDDTVEEAFIKHLSDIVSKKPDNQKIPPNYNINLELQNYLKSNYNKRTLTYSK